MKANKRKETILNISKFRKHILGCMSTKAEKCLGGKENKNKQQVERTLPGSTY